MALTWRCQSHVWQTMRSGLVGSTDYSRHVHLDNIMLFKSCIVSWEHCVKETCVIWILFVLHPLLLGYETHSYCNIQIQSTNSSHAHNYLPLRIFYLISKWRVSCLSSGYMSPPTHPKSSWLCIKLRMVSRFWRCSPISFENIFLMCVLRSTSHNITLKHRCPY